MSDEKEFQPDNPCPYAVKGTGTDGTACDRPDLDCPNLGWPSNRPVCWAEEVAFASSLGLQLQRRRRPKGK
jgi:hypothetical protein